MDSSVMAKGKDYDNGQRFQLGGPTLLTYQRMCRFGGGGCHDVGNALKE